MSELGEAKGRAPLWGFSFSIRELLMLFVIAALVLMFFVRQQPVISGNSNAPFSINSPIEYRYWHQRGSNGSGTGQIGSGNEWRKAVGIEVFENFIILHLDNGVDRMVERDGLKWFDWRPATANTSGSTGSGH